VCNVWLFLIISNQFEIIMLFVYFVGLPDLQQGEYCDGTNYKHAQSTVRIDVVLAEYHSIIALAIEIAIPDYLVY
jgi:hypothetical protein